MLISVITPVLNQAGYIREAIESVLQQEYKDYEHIVVDGGSSDGTIEILKEYPHLKWISEPDNGQANAMNKGFRMSSGQIIVYLNADDYFMPCAFQTVVTYFHEGKDFVIGKIQVLTEDGKSWINEPKITFKDMLMHWRPHAYSVNPVGYFYRREIQELIGGFNTKNNWAMDLEFLLSCSLHVNFTKIDDSKIIGVFRNIKNTKTSQFQNNPNVNAWTNSQYFFIEKFFPYLSKHELTWYRLERKWGYKMRYYQQKSSIDNSTTIEKLFFKFLFIITSQLTSFLGLINDMIPNKQGLKPNNL